MVSGGNMANLVCFWAARAARAGWDVRAARACRRRRRRGCASTDRPRRTPGSRRPPTSPASARRRSAGFRPTPISAWTSTRCAAPIEADVAAGDRAVAGRRHRGLGQHRRGRSAAGDRRRLPRARRLVPRRRRLRRLRRRGARRAGRSAPASALADSVAVDPHKWLYAPLEAGCALVRDAERLRAAFAYHPPYYHFEERATNYVDYGPQNSRGFRALKVWLALRQVGAGGLPHDDRRRHARWRGRWPTPSGARRSSSC